MKLQQWFKKQMGLGLGPNKTAIYDQLGVEYIVSEIKIQTKCGPAEIHDGDWILTCDDGSRYILPESVAGRMVMLPFEYSSVDVEPGDSTEAVIEKFLELFRSMGLQVDILGHGQTDVYRICKPSDMKDAH